MTTYLPIIDLSGTFGDDAAALAKAAQEIDAVGRKHGFFYVTGHGVPVDLVEEMFSATRRFFELPPEVKNALNVSNSVSHRGYDPLGLQSLDPGQPTDLKEGFNIGKAFDPARDTLARRHSPNQWPDEAQLPAFKSTSERYYSALDGLGRHMLGLLALALKLPRDYFAASLTDSLSTLRLLHYPPQDAIADPAQMGCGAHTDWGSVTILAQDTVGGLEVLDGEGHWQSVPPVPGAFVINLGDMAARWTNDLYRSSLHRVINRVSGRDRYSLPYFFEVNASTIISALPGCFDASNPPRYPAVTAGEHLLQKYDESRVTA
jgi:isopenicillin N synthase-like dioxygenase